MNIVIVEKNFIIDEQVVKKSQIIFYDDNNQEITREHYSSEHPLYGMDFNNLTPEIKFLILNKYM